MPTTPHILSFHKWALCGFSNKVILLMPYVRNLQPTATRNVPEGTLSVQTITVWMLALGTKHNLFGYSCNMKAYKLECISICFRQA